jgi:peroxiredoxin
LAGQYQEFRTAGAEVITITHDTLESAQSYVRQHHIPFPCLVDPGHQVYDQYKVESRLLSLGQRPGLFLVDRELVVRFAYVGSQQWQIPTNGQVLEACGHIGCAAGA